MDSVHGASDAESSAAPCHSVMHGDDVAVRIQTERGFNLWKCRSPTG